MEIKTTLKEQISNKVDSLLKDWTFDSFAVDGDRYMVENPRSRDPRAH